MPSISSKSSFSYNHTLHSGTDFLCICKERHLSHSTFCSTSGFQLLLTDLCSFSGKLHLPNRSQFIDNDLFSKM